MTGGFDRLLTATEFERFDAELKYLDGSTQPAVPAGRLPEKGRQPHTVTQHQERIWLAQQQDPDKVLRHAQTYRLGGTPDIARLARAVGIRYEGLLRQSLLNGAGERFDAWVGGLLASDDRMPRPWPPLGD